MKKVWIGIACAMLLISGCGGRGFLGGNQASVEQRDLFEKQEAQKKEVSDAEQKMKEEQVRKEQEDLKKQLAAQQAQAQKDGAGGGGGKAGAGGATSGASDGGEQPVVAPLPATTLTEQQLKETMTAAMSDPSNPLSKRSIYFGYDSMSVEEEYTQVIEAHAKFLAEHPQVKIRVEGNTDVRGSREYNLALGQRRADSVKRALSLHGVSADQVESVSFGKEKPRMPGDSEEAHQENRRVDIVYSGKDAK